MKLSWIAVACALAYPSIAVGQPNGPETAALVPPKLLEGVEPTYPEAKRASGEAASVTLTLTIDRQGRVTDVAVAESAGSEFDDAASTAARGLRFEPAQKDGEAVPAKIRYVFDFKLARRERTGRACCGSGGSFRPCACPWRRRQQQQPPRRTGKRWIWRFKAKSRPASPPSTRSQPKRSAAFPAPTAMRCAPSATCRVWRARRAATAC